MSGELRFTSAPPSDLYRQNWERLYAPVGAGIKNPTIPAELESPTPVVEAPAPKLPKVCLSCSAPLCDICEVPLA